MRELNREEISAVSGGSIASLVPQTSLLPQNPDILFQPIIWPVVRPASVRMPATNFVDNYVNSNASS